MGLGGAGRGVGGCRVPIPICSPSAESPDPGMPAVCNFKSENSRNLERRSESSPRLLAVHEKMKGLVISLVYGQTVGATSQHPEGLLKLIVARQEDHVQPAVIEREIKNRETREGDLGHFPGSPSLSGRYSTRPERSDLLGQISLGGGAGTSKGQSCCTRCRETRLPRRGRTFRRPATG